MQKMLFKVAKELNLSVITLIKFLNDNGIETPKKHMSQITQDLYEKILKEFDESLWHKYQDIQYASIRTESTSRGIEKNNHLHYDSIGYIKWFGGYDNLRQRENNFGFITCISGNDLYVHKSEIGFSPINKNDIVLFENGFRYSRECAINVIKLNVGNVTQLLSAVDIVINRIEFANNSDFKLIERKLWNALYYLNNLLILDSIDFIRILQNLFTKVEYNQFTLIDSFISNKGEVDNNIFDYLLFNLSRGKFIIDLLNSSNIDIYLNNELIYDWFAHHLSFELANIRINIIAKLIDYKLVKYDKLVYDSRFYDFALINKPKYDEFFKIVQSYLYTTSSEIEIILGIIKKCSNYYGVFYELIINLLNNCDDLDNNTLINRINILKYGTLLKDFLYHENIDIYLKKDVVRDWIKQYLPNDFNDYKIDVIAKLVNYGIIKYDSLLFESRYYDYIIINSPKYDDYFEIVRTFLNNYPAEKHIIFQIIKKCNNYYEIFSKIFIDKSLYELLNDKLNLEDIPDVLWKSKHQEIFEYILSCESKRREEFVINNADKLHADILTECAFHKLLNDEQLKSHVSTIYECIKRNIISREKTSLTKTLDFIEFLERANQNEVLREYNNYVHIKNILDPLFFKRLLYLKSPLITRMFKESNNLKSIEFFILEKIFSLFLAGNDLDIVYNVFLSELWKALKSNILSLKNEEINKLFPSCYSMRALSCEAVYWKKVNKFLCRGKICIDPVVMPDTTQHYLNYTIYDWFSHYGIKYLEEEKPSKRDFPIKLAGYFNRLREIYDRLECRNCGSLMIPNLKYSRVEYWDYDTEQKVVIKIDMAAQYRVAVFRCDNEKCIEYKKDHYINHCIGFNCHKIIDSRDLGQRCSNGLYICNECCSCCENHKNTNGFCPKCGEPVTLYEKYGSRFVYCSN